jgi:hypothetical protein
VGRCAAAGPPRRRPRALGGLDTLVVSAGVIHIMPLDEVTEAD